MDLSSRLAALDRPVRVGVIGAGVFGSQLIGQVERVPGMTTAVVADVVEENAVDALRNGGVSADAITTVDAAAAADAAFESGERPVLSDGPELTETNVDVVVEATGIPEIAARHAFQAISSGKHVVMVSVQTDALVGPVLGSLAENRGVTYTMAYGDQPAQMVGLCDWARSVGLEIVAAGRTTGGTDPHITPDEAYERTGDGNRAFYDEYGRPNDETLTAAVDGTKVAIETCATANAVGLTTDTPGMHVPEAGIWELPEVFRSVADGGILEDTGIVDVAVTDDPFSVFVVTTTDNEQLQDYIHHRVSKFVPTATDGKYQAFYRPYHFAAETTLSVASAAVRGEATGAVRTQHTAVVGAAKRPLDAGDEIGGGSHTYGLLVDSERARAENYVPLELLDGADLNRGKATDEILTWDDVVVDRDSMLFALYTLQNETV